MARLHQENRYDRFSDDVERPGVVLNIQPIADILSLSVHRQAFTGHGIQDRERDQLLWEVIGSVVIRTVGDDNRKSVSALPSLGDVIR